MNDLIKVSCYAVSALCLFYLFGTYWANDHLTQMQFFKTYWPVYCIAAGAALVAGGHSDSD